MHARLAEVMGYVELKREERGDLDHLDIERGSALIEAAAASATGLALGEIRQTHRLLGELDLYQWLVFLGQHEGRHTRQIERTLRAMPG